MKNLLIFIIVICSTYSTTPAQILKDLDKRIEKKVTKRVDDKVDRNIDKVLNKADKKTDEPVDEVLTEKPKETKKSKSEKKKQENGEPVNASTSSTAGGNSESLSASSSFDFVPGNKVLFTETFDKDATGDFPAKWNTNGSGEVVSLSGAPGKWLRIPGNTITFPETNQVFPENFTLEFDILYPSGADRTPITFGFGENKDPVKDGIQYKKLLYFNIDNSQNSVEYSSNYYSGHGTTAEYPVLNKAGKPIHVSVSVNKSRIRLYLDKEKIFDLPKAFEPASLRNNFHFRSPVIVPAAKKPFYVANFRIAEAGTDARSAIVKEMMEKGIVSTSEILFDVNSDKIKESSFEVINGFGEALKQDQTLRIKIVGHTDNTGQAAHNKQLSAKRAEAVKEYLATQHNIASERIQTEGKGDANPVASNNAEDGRAKNRRVEFVKL